MSRNRTANSAQLCRDNGWAAGDTLCCCDAVAIGDPKFVRITAVGRTHVLGMRLTNSDDEGNEEILTLDRYSWRRLSLDEWKGLLETRTA